MWLRSGTRRTANRRPPWKDVPSRFTATSHPSLAGKAFEGAPRVGLALAVTGRYAAHKRFPAASLTRKSSAPPFVRIFSYAVVGAYEPWPCRGSHALCATLAHHTWAQSGTHAQKRWRDPCRGDVSVLRQGGTLANFLKRATVHSGIVKNNGRFRFSALEIP